MARLLVGAGALANAQNKCEGVCVCVCAALSLRRDIRRAMAPRSLWRRRHGCSPLHFAAINGCLDVVQLLVGAGADVSMQDRCRARQPRSRRRAV